MVTATDAYLKGYDEACQGGDYDLNPYCSDNSGRLWSKWRQGHSDALQNKRAAHTRRRISVESLFTSKEGGE